MLGSTPMLETEVSAPKWEIGLRSEIEISRLANAHDRTSHLFHLVVSICIHFQNRDRESDRIGNIAEKLEENFYDQEFIEYSTERYDHKRGFTTLSADVKVSVKNLLFATPHLGGWTASVQTDAGTLTLD